MKYLTDRKMPQKMSSAAVGALRVGHCDIRLPGPDYALYSTVYDFKIEHFWTAIFKFPIYGWVIHYKLDI